MTAIFAGGGNWLDNAINVGLYPRIGRTPTGVTTRANARVTSGSGYVQENLSFWTGRLLVSGGLRFDEFRYVVDGISQLAGRWQGKGAVAYTPLRRLPVSLHLNYGRGINSADARGVIQRPEQSRLATTDFYQAGFATHLQRLSLSGDFFLIDNSNAMVYIPDDGSFELKGPSRAYGFEAKASLQLTRRFAMNGGLTKVGNAFYRGTSPARIYIDSAPRFVANAGVTMTPWHGWSGSLRMRAINHYRLDGEDPSIAAAGHTVFDMGVSKQVYRRAEFSVSFDNFTNRSYFETQNYFESRARPTAPVVARIHGTPGYPLTVTTGVTFRFGAK